MDLLYCNSFISLGDIIKYFTMSLYITILLMKCLFWGGNGPIKMNRCLLSNLIKTEIGSFVIFQYDNFRPFTL